jgi:hypothetical protein
MTTANKSQAAVKRIGPRSPLGDVAVVVSRELARAGFDAVLTGGASAAIHTRGAYLSHDLDFIVRGGGSRRSLDTAMAAIGFTREGDRYVHPRTPFFVEFPRGPLAIGSDFDIRPVRVEVAGGTTLTLSATDACRDRLAAFYHWADRQSLGVAVAIAVANRVNMTVIRRWSEREDAVAKFEEFRAELRKAKVATSTSTSARRATRTRTGPGRRG